MRERLSRLNQDWNADNPADIRNVFLAIDRALKAAQRAGVIPTRERAIRAAEAWILDRVRPETTDGLGAIFPPMVYIQVALQALGYARTHEAVRTAERELDRLFATRQADARSVQAAAARVGELRAALQAEHLTTHLEQTRILTPDQVRHYQVLRGYAAPSAPHGPASGHHHRH